MLPIESFSFTYDDNGNRLTRTIDSVTETYGYVTSTNRLDSVTETDTVYYSYDSADKITGIDDRTLVYNDNDRLIRVEEDGTVLGEYVYNGLGQRMKKTVDEVDTIYHWDLDDNIIAESDASGTFAKEYLYRHSGRLAMVDVATGTFYFYLNDNLGTPQMLTDADGMVVWEGIYRPFGETTVNANSTVENNFRFAGQYYDSETGLHYNYHRYYDPVTGRYLRPDPIGLDGGSNLYAYVQNNPVNSIDPYGLTQYDIDVAVRIIKETQKDLRFPNNVDPSMKSDKYAGEYRMLTDTIRLNENYLEDLTDKQAADLVDTLIHETLHANDSAWKQLLDSYRDHPDIYNEAARRTKDLLDRFQKERKQSSCN